MGKVLGRLTVFFEDSFWVGIFKHVKLSICKVAFGAEPKDYEVYDFVLKNTINCGLIVVTEIKEVNPKQYSGRCQSKHRIVE